MVLVENVKCGQTNVFNNILETKNALKTVKTTSSKSGEIDIFQRGRHEPMLFVQKWPFFQLFLGNIGKEKVFYDILERKNAFLGNKNKTLKKSKN